MATKKSIKLISPRNVKYSEALSKFQKQYPGVSSGDLQTFTFGWLAAFEVIDEMHKTISTET